MAIATDMDARSANAAVTAHPLSLAQEAVWIDQLVNRDTVNYSIGLIFCIDGELDPELLRRSFQAVVGNSDALRLVLTGPDGEPAQRVDAAARGHWSFINQSDDERADERAQEMLRTVVEQPLDLHAGSLCESQLVRVNPTRHYWLLRFHHLIVDGASFPIILQAVVEQYASHESGRPTAVLPSYLPFIAEDQAYRNSSLFSDDRRYWSERLRGVAESPIAFLYRSAARPGAVRERHYVSVPRGMFDQVAAASWAGGVSRTQLLLSALATCLARLTGRTDILIGVPFHNRTSRTARRTIGTFSCVIPVAIHVDRDAAFDDVLCSAWDDLKVSAEHSRVSLAQINRDLQRLQHRAQQVVDVTLSVESWPLDVQLGAASCRVLSSFRGAQQAALAVSIIDYRGGDLVPIELAYDPGVLSRETVIAVGDCLSRLLQGCIANPRTRVADLPMLDRAELARVLTGFNPAPQRYQQVALLHELFERQARRNRGKTALIFGGRKVGYGELDAMADDVAGYLRRRGVGSGSCVAVCLHRGVELIAALLGILKSGATYVPLDPEHPPLRLARMLENCSAPIVLTQAALRASLPQSIEALSLDTQWNEIAGAARTSPHEPRVTDPQQAAYVIYTSGSSGEPKGVVVSHAAMVNRVLAQQDFDPIAEDDVCCQKTAIGFVDAMFEILGPLSYGSSLVIAAASAPRDLHALAELIEKEAVTRLISTPSLAQALLRTTAIDELHSLRSWTLSGEALDAQLLRGLQRALPDCRYINVYGSSEVTADATYFLAEEWDGDVVVPIGRPLRNVRAYLLDATLAPVPVGIPGEIYVAGAGLARGYLNLPALDAERFRADPFAAPGERMFRTGDLGRWRADGSIEYLGRNDRQVKIRGMRVELGEIEAQLRREHRVRDVVVIAAEGADGAKRLIAYLAFDGEPLEAEALRAVARRALPAHMVPQAFVALADLPRTPNGKIDSSALPTPPAQVSAGVYEAPRGRTEELLANIWIDLLDVERVGRRDNFFDLGGHSLRLAQMAERAKRVGIQVDVAEAFATPVLAELAEVLQARGADQRAEVAGLQAGADVARPPAVSHEPIDESSMASVVRRTPGGAANIQEILPLTPLQEGLLFHHVLGERGDTYLFPTLLSAQSRGQLDRFIEALQRVVDRHDALRTAVMWRDLPQPVQVVWRHARVPVRELELVGNADEVLAQLREQMKPERLQIDLQCAPLMEVRVARGGSGQRWYALLLQHHLVSDHLSQTIALQEITAYLEGRQHELSPAAAYRNFVARALAPEQREEAHSFFARKLADIDEVTAPFGVLDVHGDGSQLVEARGSLDARQAQELRSVARSLGVGVATLLHLAWAVVVARTSGRDDVVFGSVLSGRWHIDEDKAALGMFVNTLPMRLPLRGRSVGEMIEQTHRELADLLRVGYASLPDAQACSAVDRGTPLFTAVLNYRRGSSAVEAQTRTAFSRHGLAMLSRAERSNYPFVLNVDDTSSGLTLTVQADRRIAAERVADYVRMVLAALLDCALHAPGTPVLDLPILPQHERSSLLMYGGQPRREYAVKRLLHELFEEQARAVPRAVALTLAGSEVSYGTLNARANQLARYLRAKGVGPDCLVALCVERSVEMMVGVLGILKAGGAYLPLDPSYPRERLEFVLSDAKPQLLLTQESLRGNLPPGTTAVVTLDADAEHIDALSDTDLDAGSVGVTPGNLAYVIYTSGSTGVPKGVLVEHRNVVRLIAATDELFQFDGHDVWTLFHSFAFDFSVWEMWGALSKGGRLVIVPRLTARSSEDFYRLLCEQGVTVLNQTPSAFGQLIAVQGQQPQDLKHKLRYVIFGGEALQLSALLPWMARPQNECVQLVNMYGITETTVHVTYSPIAHSAALQERSSPIGRGLADLAIYLLDSDKRLVPTGAIGELYVGGAGVARGYLDRDELTTQRFIPDPFDPTPGARMYRTGDVGRWRADGSLEYLGRNDEQVKIHGYRIELGEIEAQLCRQPGVTQAAVVARSDAGGEKRLIAYVGLSTLPSETDRAQHVAALREHLARTLPSWMLPAAYVLLGALPTTPTGKIDRARLPAPAAESYAAGPFEAPRGDREQMLAAIWQALLGVERVGRLDGFFEIGGNSLLIVRLIGELRRAGWHVPVREVFETPALATLAAKLQPLVARRHAPSTGIPAGCDHIVPQMLPLVQLDEQQIASVVARVPGGARNVQDIYPLTAMQEGILFHHLLDTTGDTYVLAILLQTQSHQQLDGLLEALQSVIDRHDVLRTAVLWEGLPRPLQVVYRRATLPVESLQLGPADDSLHELRRRMAPERLRMDLASAPLLRVHVADDGSRHCSYALLCLHHMVTDHVGLEIVLDEMKAIVTGAGAALPPASPYRDFVAQTLARTSVDAAEQFFRQRLGDVQESTAPFGLLDVHGEGDRIVEHRQLLDPQVAAAVRTAARGLGVSAATIFHAIWAIVVSRCSGRDDVVFGSVLLGRWYQGDGTERLVGVFINTLPLRVRLRSLSVHELIEHVQRGIAELVEHQDAPLALAQRCSGVGGEAPLFTALLNYRHSSVQTAQQQELAGAQVLAVQERTNYPFTLSVDDLGEGLTLTVRTDRKIAPRQIAAYVRSVLDAMLQAVALPVSPPVAELPMLSEQELRELIPDQSVQPRTSVAASTLSALFEAQVRKSPEAVALVGGSDTVSYQDLNRRANQLGRWLRLHGVRADHRVALHMPRGIDLIVCMLGVLKAGGAYVPIEPGNPLERLRHILDDSAPLMVLSQDADLGSLPKSAAPAFGFGALSKLCEELSGDDLQDGGAHVDGSALAYVIYTSGSTGRPKGVMVEHRNVVNYAVDIIERFAVTAGDGSLVATSLSFDLALTGVYPPLLCGRCVRICPDEPGALAEQFAAGRNLAPVKLTPAHLPLLEQALPRSELRDHVRVLVLGGEALRYEALAVWRKHAPDTRLFNHYGPTECTVGCVAHEITERDPSEGPVPLGRPIANARIYVLDDDMRPVPRGVSGEIYIGGPGVTRGYLNQPQLTAERFLRDPFVDAPGARMYRSGDLGRWRDDGTVEYLGRRDQQVKIRGYRIELAEIEACLRRHERVRDAVVIVSGRDAEDRRLIAYVTSNGVAPGAEILREHAAASLPEYMVPSAHVVLDAIPLTPNGKVDRQALPQPSASAYVSRPYEAPQTTLEALLARLWSELLRLERVGRHDNFFELGGHSLLIMRLMVALSEHGVRTNVRTIFQTARLADLAVAITAAQGPQDVPVPPNRISRDCDRITTQMLPLVQLDQEHIDSIVRTIAGGARNVQDVYPLAPLQEGILFHHLLDERGVNYVLTMLLEVESRAALDAFLDALQRVIDRHDVLRTAILWEGLPQAVQVVLREAALQVRELELPTGESGVEHLKQRMRTHHLRMDLTRAPLVRADICEGRGGGCHCLLQLHHLVKDHVSTEIVLSEVRAFVSGEGAALAAPVPYRDFLARALWQSQHSGAEEFFRRKLADVEETTAPFGLTGVHGDGSRIEQHREELPEGLSVSIRRCARRLGMSAATLFHAAWSVVVGRCSGREDVVFGSVLLGRWGQSAGAERAVGLFMNTLPLRIRFGELTVRELIEQVHREILELIEHDQAPLALAQRCSAIPGAAPLFTALLNYRHGAEDAASWRQKDRFATGMRLIELHEVNNYPLSLLVDDLGEAFVLWTQTDARLDPQRVSGYMRIVLQALVEALDGEQQQPASALPMLPPAELKLLLEQFNAVEPLDPASEQIHHLFEAQVQRTPHAVAVVCGDLQLTYGELNCNANQLAHYLRARGVGADRLVAVCMERSVDMIVALFGVLKAGAACVPLDPMSPIERLRRVLDDAGAEIVIANGVHAQRMRTLARPTLAIDTQREQWLTGYVDNPDSPVRKQNAPALAYVLYTSGSTGEPKGVMVEHASVISFWRAMESRVHRHVPGCRRVSMNAPLFYDASVQQWTQLLSGRTLVIIDDETRRDAYAFVEFVRRMQLEVLDGAPSQFIMLLNAGLFAAPCPVRLICAGGEAIEPSLWQRFAEAESVAVYNMYGPTECTVTATTTQVEAGTTPHIGRPLAHAAIYVLDSRRRPIPPGVTGEIYIGGEAVARGYLNRPAATEAVFVPNPYGPGRMYRTGDLGRWRLDGMLEYLGRADQQVKVRGIRVEIGEIEAQLRRHPDVADAAVIARNDASGAKHLVAYFTSDNSVAPTPDVLREHLKPSLPEHMIPVAYVCLETLPLTRNGKLDRRALPAPDAAAYGGLSPFQEPRAGVEAELARLWMQLLKLPQVGRNDSFLDLGGHSLLVMQLIGRVREVFKLDLRVRTLFENPTLESLAASIEALLAARAAAQVSTARVERAREGGAI